MMKKLVSVLLMLALVCASAAAMAECAHPNATHEDGDGYQEQLTLVGHGDGTHTRTFKVFWNYFCGDCGTTYSKYIEDGKEHENCVYKGNGVTCDICKLCNNHEFVDSVCSTCSYTCAHADSIKRNHGKWLNTVYTNVGSQEYHHAKYDYAEVYDCNTCGAEHYVVIEKGREDNEQHEWILRPEANLDSCSWCGAKKPCDTHTKGATVSTTNGTKTYTSTAAGHVASYTRTTVYTCSTCNWEFSEAETITEAQAAHTFSGSTCTVCKYTCSAHSYVDGVCSVCGNECAHTNAAHNGKGTSKLTSFVDHRDGTHTREFEVWHNYECPTCKHVFEKYIEMGTATEPHKYENGTCHVCGAKPACETHINISEVKVTDGEKTYPEMGIDYTYHTAVFERTTLYDCHDCGWQFSKTQTVMESPEKHNYDEGVCTICANACKHEYDEGAMFCKHCGMQAPTRVEQKSVEEALEEMKPEVKEALADAGLDTAEKITEKLTEAVPAAVYVEEQIQVIDVALEIQVVNEKGNPEWVEVTEENFPTEGLEVTFDPPAGTNVNDYNFVVVHMFTSPEKAGQVEVLTPTVRDGKLVVKFSALSPVSISWKAKPQTGAALPQTGDDSMLLIWAALLAVSCTALVMKKRSRA